MCLRRTICCQSHIPDCQSDVSVSCLSHIPNCQSDVSVSCQSSTTRLSIITNRCNTSVFLQVYMCYKNTKGVRLTTHVIQCKLVLSTRWLKINKKITLSVLTNKTEAPICCFVSHHKPISYSDQSAGSDQSHII